MLLWRLVSLLAAMIAVDSLRVYSSFWAPLFDPRILNYRVDAPFSPDAGKNARMAYEQKYGARGVNLIADLGNGKGPGGYKENKNHEAVHFYYTYPGAREE
ncbi:uncharacterized protein LOC132903457 [Amyelois transitella]|uniref:uncharacterized protein LOC132903457 n=1 Tax=Amyelois transitella TaxID=680683 RepID=UPI00298FEB43|nr:uncharacterized protein LOC132903457 [Amyelois transitella]